MKYRCVAEHRHDLPVAMMCPMLDIKPSGFYAWSRRRHSNAAGCGGLVPKKMKILWIALR